MATTKALTVRAFQITDIPNLDPINVYLEDFDLGRGQITISCWGSAWTAYFGAMGGNTISEFVGSAGVDYMANKLVDRFHKQTKANEKYLKRLIEAVKVALIERGGAY